MVLNRFPIGTNPVAGKALCGCGWEYYVILYRIGAHLVLLACFAALANCIYCHLGFFLAVNVSVVCCVLPVLSYIINCNCKFGFVCDFFPVIIGAYRLLCPKLPLAGTLCASGVFAFLYTSVVPFFMLTSYWGLVFFSVISPLMPNNALLL